MCSHNFQLIGFPSRQGENGLGNSLRMWIMKNLHLKAAIGSALKKWLLKSPEEIQRQMWCCRICLRTVGKVHPSRWRQNWNFCLHLDACGGFGAAVQDNAGLSRTCSTAEHPFNRVQSEKVGKVYPDKMRNNSLSASLQNINLFTLQEGTQLPH